MQCSGVSEFHKTESAQNNELILDTDHPLNSTFTDDLHGSLSDFSQTNASSRKH